MALPEAATLDTYGGTKVNLAPVEDPTTDVDAVTYNALLNDVSMMTRTAARAWATIAGATWGGGSQAVTVSASGAMWGNAVPPTCVTTAGGIYTLTWPASVDDDLGDAHAVALARVKSVSFGGTTPRLWTVTAVSANVVTIRVFDVAGAANAANGQAITVEVE